MALLDGKVAIVTGAARGIGAATAQLFAREGARVVVNDTGVARDGCSPDAEASAGIVEAIRSAGGHAVASHHSIETESGADELVALAVAEYGRLDILINNAGFVRDRGMLRLSTEDFTAVLHVHVTGSFLCTRAAAAVMKTQGGGSIVNTTGLAGLLGNFGQINISAAQAGIYGLTRTASVELQRFGIRVNAVAPLAKTRLTEDLPMFEHVDSMRAEHVAPVHLFLASELSQQVTGSVIAVAGGRLSVYRVVESAGEFKADDGGVWTAREIAEHFVGIRKM